MTGKGRSLFNKKVATLGNIGKEIFQTILLTEILIEKSSYPLSAKTTSSGISEQNKVAKRP